MVSQDWSSYYKQGFDPSATSKKRRDCKLISLWSFVASNAQCMSLDFTKAIEAEIIFNKC